MAADRSRAVLLSGAVHPALADNTHRPWPLPRGPWVMTMDWVDLLFLHWPIDVAMLRPHVPEELEIETFDGRAWIGVVPFRMARTRARFAPPVPTTSDFLELNVRTYVRAAGRSGVWFTSLDAASRLAVFGARVSFGLPYFAARMNANVDGDRIHYRSERRDRRGPPAEFAARWERPRSFAASRAGTFEHFLTERYCLYAKRRGHLVCGEIAHPPWLLAKVAVAIERLDMTRLLGMDLDGAPASVLAAAPQRVVAWAPHRWPRT